MPICNRISVPSDSATIPSVFAAGGPRRKSRNAAIAPAAMIPTAVVSQGANARKTSAGVPDSEKSGVNPSSATATPTKTNANTMASGATSRARVRGASCVNCQPRTSANAGNIGRMYDGSLEPERLKNTNTNAAQTRQNFGHEKPFAATVASHQLRRSVHIQTKSHGRMPHRAAARQQLSTLSNVSNCESADCQTLAASTNAAYAPVAGPSSHAAVMPTIITARTPASAGASLADHSCAPKTLNAAAVAQYCNGGFSKYLSPFSRGVTQSPETAISRAISA